MLGHSTTDAILIVHYLQEKFYAVNWTWPLSIWKGHLIVYPDVSSGGLFASSGSSSGWCGPYKACMKISESAWVLVATWVKSSVWIGVFLKALAWAPYCSSWFWKPSSKNFIQDVPVKTKYPDDLVIIINRWMNCKRNWSSGRPTWKEMSFGSTWAKPRSWHLGWDLMCFRSQHKLSFL